MYDSLSENESDADVMTKAVKTVSEIILTRRPNSIYNMVPLWYNRKQVYVRPPSEPDHGHQKRLNERYALTQNDDGCCMASAASLDEAVDKYLAEEENENASGIVNETSSTFSISALVYTMAVLATGASAFCLYQRLSMPNAETLNYFYAVLLCLFCHGVIFSSIDALFWALFACWMRRRSALQKRAANAAEILNNYPAYPAAAKQHRDDDTAFSSGTSV